jgi:hypothetical protein
MKDRLDRILKWFWPAHYSDLAKCKLCGQIGLKVRMYKEREGWFCNEDEGDEFWWEWQI